MKTRLDEVRRMQQLAGIVSSNYRFLREEEEAEDKSKDSKGEEGSKEVKKLDDKAIEQISKALEVGDELKIPKSKFKLTAVKDEDSALAALKQVLSPEDYKKAEQNAKLVKDKGGIKKAMASGEEVVKEEIATATVVAVLSLIPLFLSAIGSITDGVYQKFGGLSKEEKADLETYVKKKEDAEDQLKLLRKQRKPGKGKDKEKDAEMKKLAQDLLNQRTTAKLKVGRSLGADPTIRELQNNPINENRHLREEYAEGYGISREFFDVDLEKKIDAFERKIDKIDVIISKKYRTKMGDSLRHAGHALHEFYILPIETILLLCGMWNKKKRKNMANIIYCVAMIAYGLKTGLVHHIAASLKGAAGVGQIVDTALHSLEAGKSVVDTVKSIVGVATAA